MRNFTKIDLPTFDLYNEFQKMVDDKKIFWPNRNNQICLNTTEAGPDDFVYGTGSLVKDWANSKEISENGLITIHVPKRDPILHEHQFVNLVSVFRGTLFEQVYQSLKSQFNLGRVRLMKQQPMTCMTWHDDSSKRLHYPIKTQTGCMMVIEDEVMHIPQNQWWMTDTTKYHTALNGSDQSRIHLVAAILD